MLKCNQPFITSIIIAIILAIIMYYSYKHKKTVLIMLFIGFCIWYMLKNKQIDLSLVKPNNIQNNDIFDLPLYFIEYK